MAWIINHICVVKCGVTLHGAAVEVGEGMSNFTSHFSGHMIAYPCRNSSKSMLVKQVSGRTTAIKPCRAEQDRKLAWKQRLGKETLKMRHLLDNLGDTYRWFSAGLQYLQCVNNGYIATLHYAIDMHSFMLSGENMKTNSICVKYHYYMMIDI